jgi:hypothetical protein
VRRRWGDGASDSGLTIPKCYNRARVPRVERGFPLRTLLALLTIGAFQLAPPVNADPIYYAYTYELTSDASHGPSISAPSASALSGTFGFAGVEPGDPLPSPLLPEPITVDGLETFDLFSTADATFNGVLGDPVLTPVTGEWVFSEYVPSFGNVFLTLGTTPNTEVFGSLWSWTVEENGDPYAEYIDYGYQWSLDVVPDGAPLLGSAVPEPGSLGLVLAGLAASSLAAIYRRLRTPLE